MTRYSKLDDQQDYQIHPASAAYAKKEAYDSMDEEEREFIHTLANDIRFKATTSLSEAAIYLGRQILDVDEYNALWWLLGSKLRAELKREQANQRSTEGKPNVQEG